MPGQRFDTRETAEQLARDNRLEAIEKGQAVLVGSLAGVVEWTSEAWTRLTGFPLSETLDKPITHFLDAAGLEVELVEFVAQHFLEGRRCTLESGFDTFDGRSIRVHLEVEPHRDAAGDITRFIAVASDISEQCAPAADESPWSGSDAPAEFRPEATPGEVVSSTIPPAAEVDPSTPLKQTPLDVGVDRVLHELTREERGLAYFESIHGPERPVIEAREGALEDSIRDLLVSAFANANQRGAYVTVVTGLLDDYRLHRSKVHPITAIVGPARPGPRPYLEIHDTGPTLDRDALARIRSGGRDRAREADISAMSLREEMLVGALARAEALGATLHLDSTAGCGTQILVEFA